MLIVDVDVDEDCMCNLMARNQKRRLMMKRCRPAMVPGRGREGIAGVFGIRA